MTTDNILQFKPKESPKETVTNNPFLSKPPKEAEGTDGYVMSVINYSHMPLKTVPDIENATVRNKRWGAVFTVGVLGELDKQPTGPAALPVMPSQFFDADSLPALRSRLIFELDKALELAKMQIENPEQYEKCEEEYYRIVSGGKTPKA